jgi:hypothetical protein
LKVTSCSFADDSAADGGAIDNADNGGSGTAQVVRTTFSTDWATDGGAVDNADFGGVGTFVVQGPAGASSFTGDTASYDGGAIDNGDFGEGTLSVTGASFDDDTAGADGGAIDSADDAPTVASLVTVAGSTFTSDDADEFGGAVGNGDNGGLAQFCGSVAGAEFVECLFGETGGDFGIGGTARISGSTFSGDEATDGAGVDNADLGSGLASIATSTFSGGTALADGGAVDNADTFGEGQANISSSTIESNTAAFAGGGIANADNGTLYEFCSAETSGNPLECLAYFTDDGDFSGPSGLLNLVMSSLNGNSAEVGGGIATAVVGGGVTYARASTFDEDLATYDGGAIDNGDVFGEGVLLLDDSTVAGAAADSGSAIDNGDLYGAGVTYVLSSTLADNGGSSPASLDSGDGVIDLGGTVLAGNSTANCDGDISDSGFNLEDDPADTCGFSSADHDLVGVDPDLELLGAYGGPTSTFEPMATSPLLDQVPDPTVVIVDTPFSVQDVNLCRTDQQGNAANAAYGCAIGSVDVANTSLPIVSSVSPSSGSPSSPQSVSVAGLNLTGAVSVSFGGIDATNVVVSPSGLSLLCQAPAGTASTTVDVVVTTPAGSSPYRPGARYHYT